MPHRRRRWQPPACARCSRHGRSRRVRAGGARLATEVSEPRAVQALALGGDRGAELWLANLTGEARDDGGERGPRIPSDRDVGDPIGFSPSHEFVADFVDTIGLAAAAASALPATAREAKVAPADAMGMLYDTTLCIGCKTCVVACREANGLDPDTSYPTHVHNQPCSATPRNWSPKSGAAPPLWRSVRSWHTR